MIKTNLEWIATGYWDKAFCWDVKSSHYFIRVCNVVLEFIDANDKTFEPSSEKKNQQQQQQQRKKNN